MLNATVSRKLLYVANTQATKRWTRLSIFRNLVGSSCAIIDWSTEHFKVLRRKWGILYFSPNKWIVADVLLQIYVICPTGYYHPCYVASILDHHLIIKICFFRYFFKVRFYPLPCLAAIAYNVDKTKLNSNI